MNEKLTEADLLELAGEVLDIESRAVAALHSRLDGTFAAACRLCLQTVGRVVVTGMGKSGHVGNKIAATLASTGTPSFFMHPAEASHGDLGMITAQDLILAVSYSGETDERDHHDTSSRQTHGSPHDLDDRKRAFDAG